MATELRAMKNYAGHRLSPWLGHLMVSRQETARPLLTPGEVIQLPPSDELLLVSGTPPIRARKVRYFQDRRLAERVLPPPTLASLHEDMTACSRTVADDWTALPPLSRMPPEAAPAKANDAANSGIRREPELPEHEEIVREEVQPLPEFATLDHEPDRSAVRAAAIRRTLGSIARQAAMDPPDGMGL